MGYHTEFHGAFEIRPVLKPEHRAYLTRFAETRHMQRDSKLIEQVPDPVREAAGLPIGEEGAYFLAGDGRLRFEEENPSILSYNRPPVGQPGLWCDWAPTESDNKDSSGLEWNGTEKFYDYTEWLIYLIENFLRPWGYVLNGQVQWAGEDSDDRGVIHVKDNQVKAVEDEISHPKPNW